MVFIEAAACGTPSLAGEAGGTGSAVLHEQTGIRVDGNDITQVVDALRRLLTQAPLTRALGQAGLDRVQSKFAWEQVAKATRRALLARETE